MLENSSEERTLGTLPNLAQRARRKNPRIDESW
jgi:hypothetical protein